MNIKNLDFKEFYYLEFTVLLRKKMYVIKLSVSNSAFNQKPELSTQSDLARKRDIHIQTVLYLPESRLWEMTFMGNFLKYLKSVCLD